MFWFDSTVSKQGKEKKEKGEEKVAKPTFFGNYGVTNVLNLS